MFNNRFIKDDEDYALVPSAKKSLVTPFIFYLYLYFIIDFFIRFSERIPEYGALRPTLILAAVIMVNMLLQKNTLKGRFQEPLVQVLIGFMVYLAISWPFVQWPQEAFSEHFPNFVKAVVFLFFTVAIIDSRRRLNIFLGVFLLCQLFRILEPLYLHITEGYWGSETHLGRGEFADRLSGAPFDVINPNELGLLIVATIPLLHLFFQGSGGKQKLVYCALLSCMLYALLLTMSRGSFLGLFIITLFVFYASNHKRWFMVAAGVICVVGLSVMTDVQKDRYLSIIYDDTKGAKTSNSRKELTLKEFELGLEKPIVGHGLGTTQLAKYYSWGKRQASHNMYGELIIETGLIGLTIFLLFLARLYWRLMDNNRYIKDHFQQKKLAPPYSLNTVLISIFWLYAVFSLNYWGLSQYHWYFLAGVSIVYGRLVCVDAPHAVTVDQDNLSVQSSFDYARAAILKKV